MSKSKQVILKGSSAGGLATYLHADYFGSKLPPTTRFVAAPGAGFFLDAPSYDGPYLFTPHYETAFKLQNASSYGEWSVRRCSPIVTRYLSSKVNEMQLMLRALLHLNHLTPEAPGSGLWHRTLRALYALLCLCPMLFTTSGRCKISWA